MSEDKTKLGISHIEYLQQPEIEPNYLDQGFTQFKQEQINFWYYGKKLGIKNGIVISQGQILRDSSVQHKGSKFGTNEIAEIGVEYIGNLGEIAPFWSNDSITKWLLSKQNNQEQILNPIDQFNQVKNKIDYYMDFGEQQNVISTVQACWVIATYCYQLFYWFPHILFNAPSQSGKSKNATVLMYLSFRGFDLGASAGVSPAQIFRTLEGNRGTIKIDEYEKNDSDTQKTVNQILNASASKDAYVIRCEKIDKVWIAKKFPIFCPKMVCNITGINPTSLSRFIPFYLLKTIDVEKGKRKPEKDFALNKQSFRKISDTMHILILQNWRAIKGIADNLNLDLINRDEDNWFAICTIAKWLGKDVFETVLDYIKDYKEIQIESSDIIADFFYILYENAPEKTELITPSQMATWCGDLLSHYRSPASWIGWRLKAYKFQKQRGGNGRFWLISKEKVKAVIDRYFPNIATSKSAMSQTTSMSQASLNIQKTILNDTYVADDRKRKCVIHHKCVKCGNTPCVVVDPKPRCSNCVPQEIKVVEEELQENGKETETKG